MLWYNKGVYCKWQFSAGDSSLKSQFWTGEWTVLKSKNCHKFSFFLLKVQNVPPSCLSCTMELDISGHWTAFQSEWGCWKCSFAWGTGESTTNLSAHVLWRVPGCPWPWDYCSWYEIFVNENPWRFAEFHHFPFEHEISLQFSTGAFWHFYFNDVRAACYCQAHN